MKKTTIVVALFSLLSFCAVQAQRSIGIMKPPGAPIAGFPQKTTDSLYRAAEKAFFAFQSAATMRDQKTGNVTAASIDKFLSLFEFNANVVEDFLFVEPPPEIKSPDYAAFVYKYLPQGLDFRFVSAEFTNINYDSLGFYRVYARTVKVMKNGLTKDLNPVLKTDSCIVIELFTFFVEKKEMDKARIFRIQQHGKMECYNKHRLKIPLSVYGSVNLGAGFSRANMNSSWPNGTEAAIQLQSKTVQVKGFGGGIEYRLKDKPWAFHLGGQYEWFSTSVSLDTFIYKRATTDPVDPDKTKTVQGIAFSNLQETGRISVLQAKAGVTYWMMERERFNFGLDFLVMPGMVMRYKNSLSAGVRYYSRNTYPVPGSESTFEVIIDDQLPNPAYITGKYTVAKDFLPYRSGIFLSAQIAPIVEFKINSHIALRLGGYFQVSLSQWFKTSADPNTTPFSAGPEDIQYTLLSEYVDKYKVNHFGLYAGLQYQF